MKQLLKLDHPIPSAIISSLEFKNNKWYYIYTIQTEEEINNEPKDLIIYSHISNLRVVKANSVKDSVNIHFHTWDDYMKIIDRQVKADLNVRLRYLQTHNKVSLETITLDNRDYDEKELTNIMTYLSQIYMQTKDKTIFVAIY